jgi:hypothetical protein
MNNEKLEEKQTKIAAAGNIGIGMIYGAGTSGLATSAYIAVTGHKPAVWLFFLEAAMVFAGVAKSMRSDHQLNQMKSASNGVNGPSG